MRGAGFELFESLELTCTSHPLLITTTDCLVPEALHPSAFYLSCCLSATAGRTLVCFASVPISLQAVQGSSKQTHIFHTICTHDLPSMFGFIADILT